MKRIFSVLAAILLLGSAHAYAQESFSTFLANAPLRSAPNSTDHIPVVVPGSPNKTYYLPLSYFASGGAVTSVFGRTGIVTAQSGDYSFSQISGALTPSSQMPDSGASAGSYTCLNGTVTAKGLLTAAASGSCGGSPGFNAVGSGTNTTAAMLVGTGGSLGVTGSGTIGATTLLGQTWANPGTIGGGTPGNATFNNLTVNGTCTGCGGGGSGTVTSVGLSLPGIFNVTNSPVTASGTLTGALANQNANLVFAGPASGAAGAPTFRSLVSADLPAAPNRSVSSGTITFSSSDISGQVNGTGATSATMPSTSTLGAGQTIALTDQAAAAIALSGGQTLNGLASSSLFQYGWAICTGNGTSADCFGFPGFGAVSGDVTSTAVGATTVGKIGGTQFALGTLTDSDFCTWTASSHTMNCNSSGGAAAFSGITSGTNATATMTVGTGGSIAHSGSGSIDATKVNGDANVAFLDVNQSYTKGQAVTPDTATSCGTQTGGGTMTPNFVNANSCIATFGSGNLTIANPSGAKAGQTYAFKLVQDATGGRTVTWGANYHWGGATPPTLTTTGGHWDVISCIAPTPTEIDCTLAIGNVS